jgi:beta propeller repeat protein
VYDHVLGITFPVTNDAAVQGSPRVGADHVVFEDYSTGNADIWASPIPGGPAFLVAGGSDAQITPDIDLNNIVFIQNTAGTDQLFLFDLTTGTTRQLTNVASTKIQPRISRSRIVWADDRNGNLDLYLYDLSTSHEDPLVVGPGDQLLSDIDGDRVVYTDNTSGFEEIHLFTIEPVTAYSFTGFFAPVNNLPVYNEAKAGRAIPIKFSLGGDQGLDIFAPGYPSSTLIPCSSSALTDAVEETVTAGASTLRYDAAAGLYVYIWKTSDAWANTCRQFVVRLRDGNYYRANFSFK